MKRKPLFLVLFIITLLLPSKTFAEDKSGTLSKEPEISVRAFVDKSNITIGEKIKYTLEVDSNKSIDIEFPFVDSNLGVYLSYNFTFVNRCFILDLLSQKKCSGEKSTSASGARSSFSRA